MQAKNHNKIPLLCPEEWLPCKECFYVYKGLSACTYAHHMCLVPKEARKGQQILWSQSYRWL